MLAVQEYLHSGRSPEDLTNDLGIYCYSHPTLPLVGFKYHQIESPKLHPVVRDCRGIVLETGSWDVIAKPFRRFFNAGEDHENFARFNWDNFTCTEKVDGSLAIVYYYAGQWHMNTSGSFGLGEVGFSGRTWRELFWSVSQIEPTKLDSNLTYVFELWSPYNQVIRAYAQPSAFLLSVFDRRTCEELTVDAADVIAGELGVPRPVHHRFSGMDEITAFLRDMETKDRTYEGLVLRDDKNERYKTKTATYLALHHLFDNGNMFNPKRLVPLVLAGEIDEVVAYLPQIKPYLEEVQEKLNQAFQTLHELWAMTYQIESQKDFALAIVNHTPFSGLLFTLRKQLGSQQTLADLRNIWRQSADTILRHLYS